MASVSTPLNWHDEAELLGVRVRAYFFDPAAVEALADPVARLLPVLADGADGEPLPQRLGAEGARSTCRAGALQAQPDVLLSHGDGLICLSQAPGLRGSDRAAEARLHDRAQWRGQLRVDLMLQSIAAAMAAAGQHGRPTAALWRGANVLYQFDPGSPVLECLATSVGPARSYWNEAGAISPAQLASFCEPRLRALPGLVPDPTQPAAPAFSDPD